MYCVIDIGSNTIRLVIYRVEDGMIKPMLNNKRPAGLAGYVDKNGYLRPAGIEKAVGILQEFRQVLDMLPDCEVFPFATASLRNIYNFDEVVDTIRQKCGFEVRVLSGKEEALYDYHGAVRAMRANTGLLTDIGGGSTELVFFQNGIARVADSIPVGSLNLYDRFVDELLPEKKELKKMEKEVRALLEKAVPAKGAYAAQPMCAVGGTARSALELFRSITGAEEAVREYDSQFLNRVFTMLEENPRKLIRRIIKVAPDRIHTILPGMLILKVVAETYGSQTIVTSPYGVREGYLFDILEQRGILHG
jgi:exopolyphosphatase/guanosine-5'-triphosphate,3'-diphosphate pyrophosphatase